jgi:hypothetical protein
MTPAARTPKPRAGSRQFPRAPGGPPERSPSRPAQRARPRLRSTGALRGVFLPSLALAEHSRSVCSCVASSAAPSIGASSSPQAARARTWTRTAERENAQRRRAARTRRDTRARAAGRRASVGRWGQASRRRARTSGRGSEQARAELGLVAAGMCAFRYADADAFVVALDRLGRSESALAVHGSSLAPGILAREGYPNAADANEETGEFANRRGARRAHLCLGRGQRGRACAHT